MNANRTYTNNKCSEIAKDSRCWGETYELHTPVLENLSIHDTSTHTVHTQDSKQRPATPVCRPFEQFQYRFQTLLAARSSTAATSHNNHCNLQTYNKSHARNDWWYCMIATCIVGGIQCVYWRDSFCTGSDTNSIDYNVIVWVREETETEKWYSTVDPDSHFGTHNERRGICHRLLSTRTKRRHTLSKLGPSFRRWLLLGVCDWKSLIDHESVPNSITCCCAFCCCVFLLCLLRWSFGIQNILS